MSRSAFELGARHHRHAQRQARRMAKPELARPKLLQLTDAERDEHGEGNRRDG
jgi:hypothetical protein